MRERYKLICEHFPGSGPWLDKNFGYNVYSVLRRFGKARDTKGELWDKWETIAKFDSRDFENATLARSEAYKAYKRAKGEWK